MNRILLREVGDRRMGQSQEPESTLDTDSIRTAVRSRTTVIADSVVLTVDTCEDLVPIVRLLLRWMQDEVIVRILGEGRARLAAAIPANRLAHGGARVYIQDGVVPMPNTNRGGGVIAASASGRTGSILRNLKMIRSRAPDITVIGIASADATEFKELCHYFIGIKEDRLSGNPLSALADTAEYVLSQILDALVVAAGRLGGFDERKWLLGHEDIGDTGPHHVDTRDN